VLKDVTIASQGLAGDVKTGGYTTTFIAADVQAIARNVKKDSALNGSAKITA
jgi:hypothetical protein